MYNIHYNGCVINIDTKKSILVNVIIPIYLLVGVCPGVMLPFSSGLSDSVATGSDSAGLSASSGSSGPGPGGQDTGSGEVKQSYSKCITGNKCTCLLLCIISNWCILICIPYSITGILICMIGK